MCFCTFAIPLHFINLRCLIFNYVLQFVPYELVDRPGVTVPPTVRLQVSSGHECVCTFTERRCRIEGVFNIYNMLDVSNLNWLNNMTFTFNGESTFVVSAFADSLLQTHIGPIVSGIGKCSISCYVQILTAVSCS